MAKISSRISLLNSYATSDNLIDFTRLEPLDDEELESWWRTVPGARHFMNIAMNTIEKNNSVALHLAKVDSEGFIQMLKEKIRRRYLNIILEEFEYNGAGDMEDFVNALTERYAPNFLRDFTKDSAMEDLARQNLFGGYVVIVKLAKDFKKLTAAVSTFNRVANNQSGAFIFVSNQKNPSPSMARLADFLTPYDVQFFAINLLDNVRLSTLQKIYTATLVAKLAGHSAIIAKNLATTELFNDGADFVKKIIPNFDEKIYLQAVWECQVQYILPILEQVRGRLIEKNFRQLKNILPVKDEFGKIITDPWDMELRHLHFYGGNAMLFHMNDWENLELAYHARNLISHLEILDREQIDKILLLAYTKF